MSPCSFVLITLVLASAFGFFFLTSSCFTASCFTAACFFCFFCFFATSCVTTGAASFSALMGTCGTSCEVLGPPSPAKAAGRLRTRPWSWPPAACSGAFPFPFGAGAFICCPDRGAGAIPPAPLGACGTAVAPPNPNPAVVGSAAASVCAAQPLDATCFCPLG